MFTLAARNRPETERYKYVDRLVRVLSEHSDSSPDPLTQMPRPKLVTRERQGTASGTSGSRPRHPEVFVSDASSVGPASAADRELAESPRPDPAVSVTTSDSDPVHPERVSDLSGGVKPSTALSDGPAVAFVELDHEQQTPARGPGASASLPADLVRTLTSVLARLDAQAESIERLQADQAHQLTLLTSIAQSLRG